jgi:hypothetical protein
MKQSKPQTDGDLKTGDRVKLIPGTLAWNAEMTLQGKRGEVIECRDDGRISVRFENGRLLMGRPAAQFERLAEFERKVKK